jgi:hypothetical protein
VKADRPMKHSVAVDAASVCGAIGSTQDV